MRIYELPEAEYHQRPEISSSMVKLMASKTPAHVRAAMDSPSDPTPAMLLGTLTHVAVLEADRLESRYIAMTKPDLRTKIGKQEWAEAHERAEAEGKTICTAEDYDKARRMRDAVHAHGDAAKVLAKGRPEVSIICEDAEPLPIRSRQDWEPELPIIADLKTTADASEHGFGRQAVSLGYHISAYHYIRCREIELGETCDFMWIAVEKDPPYACATYYADEAILRLAEAQWREAMDRFAECQRTGVWRAYDDETKPLWVPPWVRNQMEYAA